ncbi:MAG: hypothetical protein HY876_03990 [Coriobacteriales bacterium]|nr:hypothetical protein [Coriobacteriales bacterium]
MTLNPGGSDTNPDGTDDNFGPHCRNCHTGSSSCNQCHAGSAFTNVTNASVAGKSNIAPNSYVRTSAAVNINGQCIDGGFSFPHRTLGANMLKDELYGIDFDGSPVAAGEVRDAASVGTITDQFAGNSSVESSSVVAAVRSDNQTLAGMAAENLDSVCIDCHGDATYYRPNLANELILKGLP